jgi:hypothetical protein
MPGSLRLTWEDEECGIRNAECGMLIIPILFSLYYFPSNSGILIKKFGTLSCSLIVNGFFWLRLRRIVFSVPLW